MNIFQRAHLNLDLDPHERAFLKWLGAAGLASPWVVLLALGEWLFWPGGIIWWTVIGLAIILLLHSGSIGLTKFFTSQKDGPTKVMQEDIQNIFNTVMDRVETRLGFNTPPATNTAVVPTVRPVATMTPVVPPEPIIIPPVMALPQQQPPIVPPASST